MKTIKFTSLHNLKHNINDPINTFLMPRELRVMNLILILSNGIQENVLKYKTIQ